MKLQRWARPKPGLARAPGAVAPADRLLQFQELRRALAHLDMLMLDMETGDPNSADFCAGGRPAFKIRG